MPTEPEVRAAAAALYKNAMEWGSGYCPPRFECGSWQTWYMHVARVTLEAAEAAKKDACPACVEGYPLDHTIRVGCKLMAIR